MKFDNRRYENFENYEVEELGSKISYYDYDEERADSVFELFCKALFYAVAICLAMVGIFRFAVYYGLI